MIVFLMWMALAGADDAPAAASTPESEAVTLLRARCSAAKALGPTVAGNLNISEGRGTTLRARVAKNIGKCLPRTTGAVAPYALQGSVSLVGVRDRTSVSFSASIVDRATGLPVAAAQGKSAMVGTQEELDDALAGWVATLLNGYIDDVAAAEARTTAVAAACARAEKNPGPPILLVVTAPPEGAALVSSFIQRMKERHCVTLTEGKAGADKFESAAALGAARVIELRIESAVDAGGMLEGTKMVSYGITVTARLSDVQSRKIITDATATERLLGISLAGALRNAQESSVARPRAVNTVVDDLAKALDQERSGR